MKYIKAYGVSLLISTLAMVFIYLLLSFVAGFFISSPEEIRGFIAVTVVASLIGLLFYWAHVQGSKR